MKLSQQLRGFPKIPHIFSLSGNGLTPPSPFPPSSPPFSLPLPPPLSLSFSRATSVVVNKVNKGLNRFQAIVQVNETVYFIYGA